MSLESCAFRSGAAKPLIFNGAISLIRGIAALIAVSSLLLSIHICQWVSRRHPDEFRLISLQSGCLMVMRCVHRIKEFATSHVPTSSPPSHQTQT
jgi:hypothetical protein